MSAISEHRRQLGIIAVEIMKVRSDLYDAYKENKEKLEELEKRAEKLYIQIDDKLDKE